MTEKTHIYSLADSGNPNLVMYVGKADSLKDRLRYYLCDHNRNKQLTPVHAWISELKRQGRLPIIATIELCDPSEWKEREKFWIAEHRKINSGLLNVLDGGNGPDKVKIKEFCDVCGTKRVRDGKRNRFRCPLCRLMWEKRRDREEYIAAHREQRDKHAHNCYRKNREKWRGVDHIEWMYCTDPEFNWKKFGENLLRLENKLFAQPKRVETAINML